MDCAYHSYLNLEYKCITKVFHYGKLAIARSCCKKTNKNKTLTKFFNITVIQILNHFLVFTNHKILKL